MTVVGAATAPEYGESRECPQQRSILCSKFVGIAERYPPRADVNLSNLADMLSALADGGIILSRVLDQPRLLSEQILLYRTFIRLVFIGAGD
ncbi:hypothetical protein [Sphingosinicella microcystinivorans]|nr:hypothetical protein [Sphingosinicella microcystinivorans]